jgi:hypothetical protein
VEIDRPNDDDQPVIDRASDVSDTAGSADRAVILMETRDRSTYYAELHAAVEAQYQGEHGDKTSRDDDWNQAADCFRHQWSEHRSRYPAAALPENVDHGTDEPGSWRGAGDRYLDAPANTAVNQACDRFHHIEQNLITPALHRIEAEDSTRDLVGLDHRLKSPDRIKEKVADTVAEQPDVTAEEAVTDVPDAIRFTFRYEENRYAQGVKADIARLNATGCEMVQLKNLWEDDHYRGINSRWREATTGQLFEVQFHTQSSFETKQLTHDAYERLRNPETPRAELRELRKLQEEVSAKVPIPPGVTEIESYRTGGRRA